MGVSRIVVTVLVCAWGAVTALAQEPTERFREANGHVRAGDLPKAVEIYRKLSGGGLESASLHWNWAQASAARGEAGLALWALLRGRELEPGDRAIAREIERVREMANLDPAEIAPEPMAVLARLSRRWHLGLVALLLWGFSVVCHLALRRLPSLRWLVPALWLSLVAGSIVAVVPLAGSLARPTAVVVTRGAPLIGSASPTAEILGSLREGEVLPVLERSGDYLRVEDSSGARGWAHRDEVWPLDSPPRLSDEG